MANIAEQLPDELTLVKLYAYEHESVTAFYHNFHCSEAPACSDDDKRHDETLEDIILDVKRELLQDDGVSVAIKEKSSSRLIACLINTTIDDSPSNDMDNGYGNQNLHGTDHSEINQRIEIAKELIPDYLRKSKLLYTGLNNAIDKEFCNQGLEFLMLQKSEQLAFEQGCKYVIAVEMGLNTQAILESMGYHKFYEDTLEEFIDSKFEPQLGAQDGSSCICMRYFYKKLDEN